MLKGIELAMSRGVRPDALDDKIAKLISAHLTGEGTPAADARKDLVSHHILRLAYAGSEDKRRWFIAHELALFRYARFCFFQEKRFDALR